ncbi:unnamed protein product [Vitrella brassicaformis CCMP3155]|uniref:Alveolin domain containing intermediate filament IMC13 n=1 Tax=Vitrella brassicaformis (strain CCMP3155) TaxID=1169540 RepID=A0A0G4EJG2_VITBC|nr:unnamed protein product [Vitrella brassicaformis CCMP3155]|eukprot:CEL96659.1 unnamed protein product [Vitrella brassicaformis CCMP3155]
MRELSQSPTESRTEKVLPSMQSQPLPPPQTRCLHTNPGPHAQTAPPSAGEPHVLHIPVHQEVQVRDRIVEIPEIHLVEVIKPKVTIQEVIKEVPKYEPVYTEKIVEVPQVHTVDKFVEVPQIQEVIREVPKFEVQEIVRGIPKVQVQYVDKPMGVAQVQEVIKEVPKADGVLPVDGATRSVPMGMTKVVEKIRHVPGPVQYVGVPVPKVVHSGKVEIVEKIKYVEVPSSQIVEVEKPYPVPVPGPVIDVPVPMGSAGLGENRSVLGSKPPGSGRIIQIPVEVPVEKEIIVHKPIPVPVGHDGKPAAVAKPVEQIRHVEVPEFVDEYVDVPVPGDAPIIIQPYPMVEVTHLPPIIEKAEPRYVHDPPVHLPPEFTTQQVPAEAKTTPLNNPPSGLPSEGP